jgi:uncharacterized protein YjbJ (UPF0337 family)
MRKLMLAALSSLVLIAAVPATGGAAAGDILPSWQQIEGNWNQFAGQMRQQWGKLTDDDIAVIKGRRQELVGKLQKRYGISRQEAERQVDAWQRKLKMPNRPHQQMPGKKQ